jgi:hypothetical protein
MSIIAEYRQSMNDAARGALRGLLAEHPTTSVADLRELVAEDPALGSLTLTELLGRPGAKAPAVEQRQRAAKPGRKPQAAAKGGRSRDQWDTQTAEGRAALDRAVLEALAVYGGVSVSAEAIRARLGATPDQLRASLNRHIEAGDVSFSGKARGTRYSLEA